MVKIFIVYGKPEGQRYANIINQYFKKNGLGSFLASPHSPDIRSGEEFQKIIDRELETADIAVVTVTRGLKKSVAAMDEIAKIKQLTIPIIPYVKNNTRRPDDLLDYQIVKFTKNVVATKRKLNELELEIWRRLDRENQNVIQPTNENTIPIFQKYTPMEREVN